jgi:hypothetical protein
MPQAERWTAPPRIDFPGSVGQPPAAAAENAAEAPMTGREALWIALFTAICVGAARLAGL